jgi:hypothetical protein
MNSTRLTFLYRLLLGGAAALLLQLTGCGGGSSNESGTVVDPGLNEMPTSVVLSASTGTSTIPAIPGVRVVSFEKLSETRVSRTEFDYVFKIKVANDASVDMASVVAKLTAVGNGSKIIDGISDTPLVTARSEVFSSDTITIRQDRTQPFDAATLRWEINGFKVVQPSPPNSQVASYTLKPGIEVTDGSLLSTSNPLQFASDAARNWVTGQIVIRGGRVYKVVGVENNADGTKGIAVEERPFHEAFSNLAFRSTFNPIVYGTNGQPVPVARSKSAESIDKGDVSATRMATAPTVDQVRALMRLSCIAPRAAVEAEPGEIGYTFGINCSLGQMLGLNGTELDAVRVDGPFTYTGKSTYIFNSDSGDDYVEDSRNYDISVTLSLDMAALLRRLSPSISFCKVDEGGGAKCKIPLFKQDVPFEFPIAAIGPVVVTATVEFSSNLEITAEGKLSYTLESSTKTIRIAGRQGGIKKNTLEKTPVREPSETQFVAEAAAAIDVAVTVAADVGIGHLAGSPITVAGIAVSGGGYARVEQKWNTANNASWCRSWDAGVVVGGSISLFPVEAINFDGIPLVEGIYRYPLVTGDAPSNCAELTFGGRVRFGYELWGHSFHTLNVVDSDSSREVYDVSGAWLLEKLAGQTATPDIIVSLASIKALNPAVWQDIILEHRWVDRPSSSTATLSRGERRNDSQAEVFPVLVLEPGNTRPGESLTLEVAAYLRDRRDTTIVTKQIQLRFERPLTSAPTYRYAVDSDGRQRYSVTFNYGGDTANRLQGGQVVMTDGETYNIAREVAADGSVSFATERTLNYRLDGSYAVQPSRLVLMSKATFGKSGAYSFPIFRDDRVVVDNPMRLQPNPASPGDKLTLEVNGVNLPEDMQVAMPNCTTPYEVRTSASIASGRVSTEYRKFNCTARTVSSSELRATVLGGSGSVGYFIFTDANVPMIVATPSPASIGESVSFALRQLGDWVRHTAFMVWNFGADLATRNVNWGDSIAQIFGTAGTRTVAVEFRDEFGNIVGQTSTQLTINTSATAPAVSGVTPDTAVAGVQRTFDVRGSNLPEGLVFTLVDCGGVAPVATGGTTSLRQFTCTFPLGSTPGPRAGTVALSSSPFGAPALRSFTVNLSAPISDITQGLVLHLPLNGSAVDLSPAARNGAVVGAVATADRNGVASGAMLFGSGRYITVPMANAQQSGAITVASWVRLNANVGATQARIVNRQSTQGGVESWGLSLFGAGYGGVTAGNRLVFHGGNGIRVSQVISTASLAIDRWYHVVGVNDGQSLSVYIDGVLDATAAGGGLLPASNLTDVVIGKTGPNAEFWVPGALDEVRVYDRALSAQEVGLLNTLNNGVSTSRLPHTGIKSSQCYAAGSNALVACNSAAALSLNSQQDGMRGNINTLAYSQVGKPGGGVYDLTECVQDTVTGLIWEGKPSSGPRAGSLNFLNHPQLVDDRDVKYYVSAVNSMTLCGFSDWRLPTGDELHGLVDYSVLSIGPTISAAWFPNTRGTRYWTSTAYSGLESSVWALDFGSGSLNQTPRLFFHAARLVRSNQ